MYFGQGFKILKESNKNLKYEMETFKLLKKMCHALTSSDKCKFQPAYR